MFFFFSFHGFSFIICHFILSFGIRERWSVLQHCMENYSSSSADVWIFAVRHGAAPENLRVRPTIVFPSQEQIGAGADKFLQSHFDVGWSPIVLFPYFTLNKSQMSAQWGFSFFFFLFILYISWIWGPGHGLILAEVSNFRGRWIKKVKMIIIISCICNLKRFEMVRVGPGPIRVLCGRRGRSYLQFVVVTETGSCTRQQLRLQWVQFSSKVDMVGVASPFLYWLRLGSSAAAE